MSKSLSFPGLSEYVKQINSLSQNSLHICEAAVAKGAGIIADTLKGEIEDLPTTATEFDALVAFRKKEKTALTPLQKEGLIESMGLAKMQNNNGFVNTKLGFDGYNKLTTKKFPKGQPNAMIARSLESGSSVLDKNPFVRRAVNSSKKKAEKAIETELDKQIKKLVK